MMGGSGENKQKNGQKNAEFKKVNQKKLKMGKCQTIQTQTPPQAPSTRGDTYLNHLPYWAIHCECEWGGVR